MIREGLCFPPNKKRVVFFEENAKDFVAYSGAHEKSADRSVDTQNRPVRSRRGRVLEAGYVERALIEERKAGRSAGS